MKYLLLLLVTGLFMSCTTDDLQRTEEDNCGCIKDTYYFDLNGTILESSEEVPCTEEVDIIQTDSTHYYTITCN